MNEKQVRWGECAASPAVATLPLPSSSCKPVAAAGTGMGSGTTHDEPVVPAPADAGGSDTTALRPRGDLFDPRAGAAVRTVCSTAGYVSAIQAVVRYSSPTNSRRCER